MKLGRNGRNKWHNIQTGREKKENRVIRRNRCEIGETNLSEKFRHRFKRLSEMLKR